MYAFCCGSALANFTRVQLGCIIISLAIIFEYDFSDAMDLLPDTENRALRMRRECFPQGNR